MKYFVAQGCGGIFKNGYMSLASLSIVGVSVFMFVIFALLGLNLSYFGKQMREQYEIRVFISDKVGRSEALKIGAKCEKLPDVKAAIFISKEEGLETLKKHLSNKPEILEALDNDNPLRDEYRLILSNVESADTVYAEVSAIDGVDSVSNDKEFARVMITCVSLLKSVGLWIAVLLAVGAVVIISNTIKIAMFARRKEINIMKFLGATNSFISASFVIEGILIGLVGTLITLAISLFAYSDLLPVISNFIDIFKMKSVAEVAPILSFGSLGLGVGIGLIGSFISVRKHLHV